MSDLHRAVASILDSRPDPGIPEPVAQVDAFAAATRRIVEDDTAPLRERLVLLLDMASLASEAVLPAWCRAAIAREAAPLLGSEEGLPELLPPGRVAAARPLRARGYSNCPVCAVPVLSELEERLDANRCRWRAEDLTLPALRAARRNGAGDGAR